VGSSGLLISTSSAESCRWEGWESRTAATGIWVGRLTGERGFNPSSERFPISGWRGCYPGSVMLEATTLSEGRGTTRPAGVVRRGAPIWDVRALLAEMHSLATPWMSGWSASGPAGSSLRFHKHVGKLCAGLQVHVEDGPRTMTTKFSSLGDCSRLVFKSSEEAKAGL